MISCRIYGHSWLYDNRSGLERNCNICGKTQRRIEYPGVSHEGHRSYTEWRSIDE